MTPRAAVSKVAARAAAASATSASMSWLQIRRLVLEKRDDQEKTAPTAVR